MNVIFLDVDGVLNSIRKLKEVYLKTHKSHSLSNYPFDEECLNNLKKIVDEFDLYIVITSTWRKNENHLKKLLFELSKYGLDSRVIGCTKVLDNRENEIIDYLNNHKDVDKYIILDDDYIGEKLESSLIKTDNNIGFSSEDSLKCIKKLKR